MAITRHPKTRQVHVYDFPPHNPGYNPLSRPLVSDNTQFRTFQTCSRGARTDASVNKIETLCALVKWMNYATHTHL